MPKKPSSAPKPRALPSGTQLQIAHQILADLLARDFSSFAIAAALARPDVPPADAFRHARRQDEARLAERLQQLAEARRPEVYQLKIALKGARPPIWRRVLVQADITLAELHRVIQAAMGWQDCHMHAFTIDGEAYGIPAPGLGTIDERKVKLARIVPDEGLKFSYEYDFGDGWEHQITLEKRLPLEPEGTYPACIKGKGACPPEDSGGLWGYYDNLEILTQPRHPEHKDVKARMGASFDPDRFDLAEANTRLQATGKGRKRR